MANEVLQKVGTQIRFAVAGSLTIVDPATDWVIGTPTEVPLSLASVATTAGRQSDKADLGTRRAASYEVLGSFDFSGETITVPGTIDCYWAPSTHTTPANGNVAGNSGVDGGAPDGALGTITLAEFIKQCIFIGSLVLTDDGNVQCGYIGTLSPTGRYGQLIVVNNCDSSFEDNNEEAHVVLNPIVDEVQ